MNYLNNILARIEANNANADEAIMLNQQGKVAEGSVDNVFIVKDNILLTPSVDQGALVGITRKIVLNLAKNIGLTSFETSLTPYDLYTADECFLTGTAAEMIPVREIDHREMRSCPGPWYQRLSNEFKSFVEQKTASNKELES